MSKLPHGPQIRMLTTMRIKGVRAEFLRGHVYVVGVDVPGSVAQDWVVHHKAEEVAQTKPEAKP